MNSHTRAKAAQPDRIWLQDGCTCGIGTCVCDPSEDAYDGDVTWCRDRINPGDSEYLRATPERVAASRLLEAALVGLSVIERTERANGAPSPQGSVVRAAIRAATGEGA